MVSMAAQVGACQCQSVPLELIGVVICTVGILFFFGLDDCIETASCTQNSAYRTKGCCNRCTTDLGCYVST